MKRALLLVLALLVSLPAFAAKPNPPAPADLNSPPADAEKSADGLLTKQLAPGSGTGHPAAGDFVHMKFTVWKAPDGSVIDAQDRVAFVHLAKLLPGLRETLMLMIPGERRRAWIPASLGGGKIPAGSSFVVDAELVDIVPAPAAPADVAAPPADAVTTPSGLAYKVLRPGTGSVHPRRRSTVDVHYTGWTTDGQMFDSSVIRDEPAEFSLDAVIPGWTEGLQLMTEGEVARFWIPSKLAYRNEPGKPHGTLVFDVQLIRIK